MVCPIGLSYISGPLFCNSSDNDSPNGESPQKFHVQTSDYLKLQELYEQREALEEEILKLYGTWERLSAELEEARG